MHSILYSIFYCISFTQFSSIVAFDSNDYKLTIIHSNDLFSAFAGVNNDNSLCDLNNDLKYCVGGAPKIVSKIRELRSKEFLLFVNSGNNLGGFWYKHFGSKVVVDFLREIQFDVITLGLSDYELYNLRPDTKDYLKESFDNITQFISDVSFFSRIVSCNVDVDTKYISNFYSNVRKSTKIAIGNRRIGVIGFVKPTTPLNIDSNDGLVKFGDPIKCLQEESESLRKEGIDIVLAMGSGDADYFKQIASNVANIDLVIGSYASSKNLTLLSQRTSESYPDFVVEGTKGNVIVATADVLGKSLGKLTVQFDRKGNIKSTEGTLIRLENGTETDMRTSKLLDNYQRSLFIGTTRVFLNATDCAVQECNLGNLLTDAFVFYGANYINKTYIKSLIKDKGNELLNARIDENRDVIAFINSESISNSIGNINTKEYFITKISLDNVFNRGNPKIQMFILDGKTIRHILEAHVQSPNLLQVSGIKVIYDLSKPINNTIIEISVKCTQCSDEYYTQLNDTKLYDVLLPQSIDVNHYNSYLEVAQELSAFDIVEQYIKENSPINTTLSNRITIIRSKEETNEAFGAKTKILVNMFSTLIAFCHIWCYN